jgi:hypothetical protein
MKLNFFGASLQSITLFLNLFKIVHMRLNIIARSLLRVKILQKRPRIYGAQAFKR